MHGMWRIKTFLDTSFSWLEREDEICNWFISEKISLELYKFYYRNFVYKVLFIPNYAIALAASVVMLSVARTFWNVVLKIFYVYKNLAVFPRMLVTGKFKKVDSRSSWNSQNKFVLYFLFVGLFRNKYNRFLQLLSDYQSIYLHDCQNE